MISRIKEINNLDLNLEEIEIYFDSNNLGFYRFTSSSKLVFNKNIDTTFDAIL